LANKKPEPKGKEAKEHEGVEEMTLEKRLEAIEAKLHEFPPGNSLSEKCYLGFIDFVNPKFRAYNRPLLLAVLVSACTLVLTLILMSYFEGQCSSTTVVSFPQFIGKHYEHYEFIENMEEAQVGEDPQVKVCINAHVQIFAASSARTTDFFGWTWTNGGGTMVSYAESCVPPRWFMEGIEPVCTGTNDCNAGTNKCVDPDDFDTAEKRWSMEFCDENLKENYDVYPYTESVEMLQAREDATKDTDPLYCPAQEHSCGGIPWSVQYKLSVYNEVCTSRGEAFGTALAYSAYAEILFTVLIVGLSLACGRHGPIQPKKKKTSLFSTIDI
jgi:hypothetical protein